MSTRADLARMTAFHVSAQASALEATRAASQAVSLAAALAAKQAVTIARLEERQEAHQLLVSEQLGTIKAILPELVVRMGRIENQTSKMLGYALGVSAAVSLGFSGFMAWAKAR